MAQPLITLDSVVVQSTGLTTAELDDETILLGMAQDAYYGMAATAQHIWQEVAQPQSVRVLVAKLTTRYAVDTAVCADQTCAFLSQLHAEGLILVQAERL